MFLFVVFSVKSPKRKGRCRNDRTANLLKTILFCNTASTTQPLLLKKLAGKLSTGNVRRTKGASGTSISNS